MTIDGAGGQRQLLLLLAICLLWQLGAHAHGHGHSQASTAEDNNQPRPYHRHVGTLKVFSNPASEGYGSGSSRHYMPTGHYNSYPHCSCANPAPLHLDHVYKASAAGNSSTLDAEGENEESPSSEVQHNHGESDMCEELPRAGEGHKCGAGLGICAPGLCCSQTGLCTKSSDGCDGTCQCKYSGPGSKCKGMLPFALPYKLPEADPGGLCGMYIATCPRFQCCSQFGFCVDDTSPYCNMPSCIPGASLMSTKCMDSELAASAARTAAAPAYDHDSPNYSYKRGTIRRFDWVVTWKNLTLDGFTKPVIVVNGQPFPNIRVNVDDRVIVKVTNLLGEPLSIHWHGMLQRRTNIQDGVVPVTQRPVDVGETYIYNFIADTAGTFWWHSHYKTQYIDGLWGAFVIDDPTTADEFPVDEVVTMSDWYHEGANALTAWYLSPESEGDEPVPYDGLLNGWGQGYCEVNGLNTCIYSYIRGVASSCANPKTKLRLINAGGFAVFNVSIDNHRMVIIAEDGVLVEPAEVGSLQINNGQRYTVLACQDTGDVSFDPVWIRATMIDDNFAYPSKYNTTLGVLYFRDEDKSAIPTSQAVFQPPAMTPSQVPGDGIINPYVLRALGGITPPGPADMTLQYDIFFYNEPPWDDDATQYAHFSNISLSMDPESPSLLERYTYNPLHVPPPKNPAVPPGGLGWNVVEIPLGAVVDIVINNQDTGEHPIHLHGHWFWVMDAGMPKAGDYDPKKGHATLGGHLARDTVTVNLESYVVLRYLAVNPGMWIMHCHIDWHLAGGLGLIFKEGFPPTQPGPPPHYHNGPDY